MWWQRCSGANKFSTMWCAGSSTHIPAHCQTPTEFCVSSSMVVPDSSNCLHSAGPSACAACIVVCSLCTESGPCSMRGVVAAWYCFGSGSAFLRLVRLCLYGDQSCSTRRQDVPPILGYVFVEQRANNVILCSIQTSDLHPLSAWDNLACAIFSHPTCHLPLINIYASECHWSSPGFHHVSPACFWSPAFVIAFVQPHFCLLACCYMCVIGCPCQQLNAAFAETGI